MLFSVNAIGIKVISLVLFLSTCSLSAQGDCVDLDLNVLLEGILVTDINGDYVDEMLPTLNQYGYLPGQEPTTLFGNYTGSGQPFYQAPWSYLGEEGLKYDTRINPDGEAYPEDAIDWVLVSLRKSTERQTTECMGAALVLSNGSVFLVEEEACCALTEDEYYVAIEHRNHLPILSAIPLPVVNGSIAYDFIRNQSYMGLLGSGQKEILQGVFAMYAGNGDQQSSFESPKDINFSDFNVWSRQNGRHSGYYNQDFDLNGDVNVVDKVLWLKNIGIFTDVD